jgi:hypothetical protein
LKGREENTKETVERKEENMKETVERERRDHEGDS